MPFKEQLLEWWPFGAMLGTLIVVMFVTQKVMARGRLSAEKSMPRQITLLVITLIGLVLLVMAAPLETELRGQVLNLLGIAITAVIAMSSTTFVSNMMGGLMLRGIRSYKRGDYISVNEQFGRVTERGLIHTEIQTEDRDLVTLPNLLLVTHPVKVVHASGTVISAQLSLGYDVPQERISKALKAAAQEIGLTDCYVHVLELNDFSVTYKIAGFLENVEHLLTMRSRLRSAMLDALHSDQIEIVSPTFMNQRVYDTGKSFIPKVHIKDGNEAEEEDQEALAEDVAFDKALRAGDLEVLEQRHKKFKKELSETKDEERKERLKSYLTALDERIQEAKDEISKA
jgi:small conductance mechanosensitive channel